MCDLTCLFTAIFITAIRAIVLSITAPWQPHASTWHAAKLIGHAHRCTWPAQRHPGHTSQYIITHMYPCMDKTWHTAVLLVWLVVAVIFSVTPPAGVYTHPTAAHELCRTARLVWSCTQTKSKNANCVFKKFMHDKNERENWWTGGENLTWNMKVMLYDRLIKEQVLHICTTLVVPYHTQLSQTHAISSNTLFDMSINVLYSVLFY